MGKARSPVFAAAWMGACLVAACGAYAAADDGADPPTQNTTTVTLPDASEGTSPGGCDAGCQAPLTCDQGVCVPPSCAGLGATCGAGRSCCESVIVSGDYTFPMGRGPDGGDAYDAQTPAETPEHLAFTQAFRMDIYEVTVGRFRKFVQAYAGPPREGAGAHPKIAGSGWSSAWNASLPAARLDTGALTCSPYATWTTAPGANEDKAMSCVTWFEAFAFCVSEGARLPTEVEWEFEAAGSVANRLFPWGNAAPVAEHAAFGCASGACVARVGSHPSGQAVHGVMDLAGNVYEWMLDYYNPAWYGSTGAAGCASANCANVSSPQDGGVNPRAVRGGSSKVGPAVLRGAARVGVPPTYRSDEVGVRCVR